MTRRDTCYFAIREGSAVGYKLLQPVRDDQIAAATRIHDNHMYEWFAADRALDLLRESLPGLDEPRVLIKASVIDRLYYARHARLVEAVRKIAEVMVRPPSDPVGIVEAIAPLDSSRGRTCYWSFSSKFAHFFIDPEAFPIYDDWAIKAIRHHFGRLSWLGRTPYRAFADYVFTLRELSGLSCSIRELDRYLWLSGMRRAWQTNADVGISREVRSVFEDESPDVQQDLDLMLD